MTNWDPGCPPCCRRAACRRRERPTPAECLACLGPLTPCPPHTQPHQGGIQVSLGAGQPARPPSRPHLCSPGPSFPPPGSVVDVPQVTTFLTSAFSLRAERDSILTVCLLSGVVTRRLRKRPGLRRGTALCSQPACNSGHMEGAGVYQGRERWWWVSGTHKPFQFCSKALVYWRPDTPQLSFGQRNPGLCLLCVNPQPSAADAVSLSFWSSHPLCSDSNSTAYSVPTRSQVSYCVFSDVLPCAVCMCHHPM